MKEDEGIYLNDIFKEPKIMKYFCILLMCSTIVFGGLFFLRLNQEQVTNAKQYVELINIVDDWNSEDQVMFGPYTINDETDVRYLRIMYYDAKQRPQGRDMIAYYIDKVCKGGGNTLNLDLSWIINTTKRGN